MRGIDFLTKFLTQRKHKKNYKEIIKFGYIKYYINHSISIYAFMVGKEIELKLQNGKIGIFKILSATDESDGWSSYDIVLGLMNYKNEKQFKDMNFDEYLNCGIINHF